METVQRNRTLGSELELALTYAEAVDGRARVELSRAGGEVTAMWLAEVGNGRAFVGQGKSVSVAVRRMMDEFHAAMQVHVAQRRRGD